MSTIEINNIINSNEQTEKFFLMNTKNYAKILFDVVSSDFNLMFPQDSYHTFVGEMLDGIKDKESKIHKIVVGTLMRDLYNGFCKYRKFKSIYGTSEEFTNTYPDFEYFGLFKPSSFKSMKKFRQVFYESWNDYEVRDDLVYFISEMLQYCENLHIKTTSGEYLLLKSFSDLSDDIDSYNSPTEIKRALSYLSNVGALPKSTVMLLLLCFKLLNKIKYPSDEVSLIRLPLELELDYVKNNSDTIVRLNERNNYHSFVISPECFENLPENKFSFLSKYVDPNFGIKQTIIINLSNCFFLKQNKRIAHSFTQFETDAYTEDINILKFFILALKMKV